MDTYRGVDEWVLIGEADSCFQVWRSVASSYGYHLRDAGGHSALDYLLAVGVELIAVEVAVRVYQH
jgi:hypothetical protein